MEFTCVAIGVFANQDAVFILSYSVIMLNTDQHNKQIRVSYFSDMMYRRSIQGADI
jgi:brefeldin A-resistance guanine nucleotide exchange factor 1